MLVLFCFLIYKINIVVMSENNICENFECDDVGEEVCGIRTEGEGFRLKLFPSECDLFRNGCKTNAEEAYAVVNMDYCIKVFKTHPNGQTSDVTTTTNTCIEYDCSFLAGASEVCGIKRDGQGFRVRLFENKCQLWKYNCDNGLDFNITDLHICKGMELSQSNDRSDNSSATRSENSVEHLILLNNSTEVNDDSSIKDTEDTGLIDDSPTPNNEVDPLPREMKNIVVVRGSLIDFEHINESIENFFAATHVFDLPVREVDKVVINETTRRRLVNHAGPVRVFVPWIIIPKNISEDFDHRPTLSSCYHKCPRKCPETYAPVCGNPGIVAREPSLMFQNHCFMDVAQCKMFWENKSPTSISSSYVEASFTFCLGYEMNSMYRFLPLIKTLQHMGRLRKKGRFHYRLQNLKFFNNLVSRQPKFMGK